MPKQISKDLSVLTEAERLWLTRTFGQGVSQDVAAPGAGLSHNRYVAMELGRLPLTPVLKGQLSARKPALGQRLRLARRRSGRQLRALATAVGVSHVTFLKLERRADLRLVRFWESNGFRF